MAINGEVERPFWLWQGFLKKIFFAFLYKILRFFFPLFYGDERIPRKNLYPTIFSICQISLNCSTICSTKILRLARGMCSFLLTSTYTKRLQMNLNNILNETISIWVIIKLYCTSNVKLIPQTKYTVHFLLMCIVL